MSGKNPLEEFLNNLDSILNLTNVGKGDPKGEIPENVEEQLSKLDQAVKELNEKSKKLFSDLGLPDAYVQADLVPEPELTEKEKKLINRTNLLKSEFEKAKRNVAIKEMLQRPQKKGKVRKEIKRKKKFRRLGGREDWKPL